MMQDDVKKYLSGDKASIQDIEDFLGYQITADILEDLESYIEEAAEQMPDDVMEAYYNKFCR